MADSLRERILQQIKITLEAIRKPAYLNDVQEVLRADVFLLNRPAYPALAIFEPDERFEERPNPYMTCLMTLTIGGAVRHAVETEKSTVVGALLQDIYRAMLSDVSRGGLAINTTLVSNLTAVAEGDPPIVICEIVFEILYRHVFADPAQANP